LLQPRAGAGPESRRLVDLGVLAFKAQQYGLAAWRFQQASVIDPTNARSFFLLAQAYVGVGQFRDAVWAVQEGLRLQPDWPVRDFRPRRDLYGIGKADWLEHVRRVDDAVTRQPDDSAYLFLRAYVAWFDGRRPQAAEWFHQARALVADPRWIDLFLLQAPPPAIANR
jgi:Flp pilus assembly protein TadD